MMRLAQVANLNADPLIDNFCRLQTGSDAPNIRQESIPPVLDEQNAMLFQTLRAEWQADNLTSS
jgi:hypothetical protein